MLDRIEVKDFKSYRGRQTMSVHSPLPRLNKHTS